MKKTSQSAEIETPFWSGRQPQASKHKEWNVTVKNICSHLGQKGGPQSQVFQEKYYSCFAHSTYFGEKNSSFFTCLSGLGLW